MMGKLPIAVKPTQDRLARMPNPDRSTADQRDYRATSSATLGKR